MLTRALQFLHDVPAAQRALAAGVAVALVCSVLSVFVVLKRMAFIGQGVSHAGYGAAGTAFFLGLLDTDPRYDAVVFAFCIATAVLIGIVSRKRQVNEDTAIGILLVAGMAWGVAMTNLSAAFQKPGGEYYWPWYVDHLAAPGARPSFESVLFGAILNTSPQQMWLSILLALVVTALVIAFFKEIVFFTFDEPTSRVYGVRTGLIHQLLMVLLAITVVQTMKLAGVLLVSAILVIPGATALMLSRRLATVMVWSCTVGVVGVAGGLLTSLQVEFIGPGPAIVAILCMIFGTVFAGKGALAMFGRQRA